MVTPQIIEYVQSQLKEGVDPEIIKGMLRAQGWDDSSIEEAFKSPLKKSWGRAKKQILWLVLILGLAFAGIAAGAYYELVYSSPVNVLQRSVVAMRTSKVFDFSGTITANINSEQSLFSLNTFLNKIQPTPHDPRVASANTVQFGVDFSGSTDLTDINNPKTDINWNFKASILSFGISTRYLDQILYFKVDQIPSMAGSEYAKYANSWIKVDPKSLAGKYGLNINFQNGQPNLTDGQKQQLADLTSQTHFFQSVTKSADDSIDGVGMYHYSGVVDKAQLKNYLDAVEKINTSAGGYSNTYNQALSNLDFGDVDIWIGKKDRMIHRISTIMSEKAAQNSTSPSGSLNLVLNLKNYNQASPIVAPTDAKNLEDVIADITAGAVSKTREARRIADVRVMMTALELYYNDHAKYPKALTDLKTILPVIPTAPLPPDGSCTDAENTYAYIQKNSGKDYALNFCIGQDAGGFAAGVHTASSSGVK